MSTIRAGLLANYAGRFLGFAIIAAATPLQIRYLGIQAYGVVGLALTVQSLVSLFDFGMSATVHRELARRCGRAELEGQSSVVVRELERVYWSVALAIGVAVAAASPLIAARWLNTEQPETLALPLAVAGIAIALNLPIGFYAAGLLALQRQTTCNLLSVAGNLVKYGGGVVVAALSQGSLVFFFAWTALASLLSVVAHRLALDWCLPRESGDDLREGERRAMWRFTAGVSAISIGLLLTSQIDKVLVSGLIALEEFAYYSLAATAIGGLYLLYQPVVATFAPKLTQAVGAGDDIRAAALYHSSSQLLAAAVFPAAVVVAAFSPEVLWLWTGSEVVAERTAPLVMALMPGALAGAAVGMPYSLLRAAGWTSMPARILFATLIVFVPALSAAVALAGPLGGAIVWSTLVVVQSALVVVFMHRRLLRNQLGSWLIGDIGVPLASSVVACAVIKMALPPAHSLGGMALVVAAASVGSFSLTLIATETTRMHLITILLRGGVRLRAAAVASRRA